MKFPWESELIEELTNQEENGDINLTNEDYDIISEIDFLLEKDPKNYELLTKKAWLYFQGNDDLNVYLTYRKIIDLYPKSTDAYFWLSFYMLDRLPMTYQIIEIAKAGLKIDPKDGKLHAIIAWALYYANKNQWTEETELDFVTHMQNATNYEPSWISLWITLAEHFISRGWYDFANDSINSASKLIRTNFREPADPQEKYYEYAVTGRSRPDNRETLNKMISEIEKHELRH